MFLNRLFLRVSLAICFSMVPVLELQAVPPKKDTQYANKTKKRKVSDSRRGAGDNPGASSEAAPAIGVRTASSRILEPSSAEEKQKRKVKKGKVYHDVDEHELFWDTTIAATDAAVEAYYRNSQKHTSPTQSTGIVNEDTFWADAVRMCDAAVERFYQTQSSQFSSSTPTQRNSGAQGMDCSPSDPRSGTNVGSEEDFEGFRYRHLATPQDHQDRNSQEHTPPTQPTDIVDEDTFWADAVGMCDAAVERFYHTQSNQSSSISSTPIQISSGTQAMDWSQSDPRSGTNVGSEEDFEGFRYRHLTTPRDHQDHLIDAINSAERSLLITSYTFSADMTARSDLFKALKSACQRGVRVYIYANDFLIGRKEIANLNKLRNLRFDYATIHSKLLVVDSRHIACGSYDWLSNPWPGVSHNASLVIESSDIESEVDSIWYTLKQYRRAEFSPSSLSAVKNCLEALVPSNIQLEHSEDLITIMNTPYQHKDIFQQCFEETQRQLTICCPFIRGGRQFLRRVLPYHLVLPFLKAGKRLNFICRKNDDKLQLLKDHLNRMLSKKYKQLRRRVSVTCIEGLHRKTLFADNDLYIEGSYNWLSSARTLDDPYYFMETSLQFSGAWAEELIREFPF